MVTNPDIAEDAEHSDKDESGPPPEEISADEGMYGWGFRWLRALRLDVWNVVGQYTRVFLWTSQLRGLGKVRWRSNCWNFGRSTRGVRVGC